MYLLDYFINYLYFLNRPILLFLIFSPMILLETEKLIIKCGVLGCPLNKVPTNLLGELGHSKIIEIVLHSDNLTVPDSVSNNIPAIPVFSLDELDSYEGYDARIKTEVWRRIVFKNSNLHSGRLAHLISILMQHPEGLSDKEIREKTPESTKSFKKWMKLLKKEDIIHTYNKNNGTEYLKFNFSILDEDYDLEHDILRTTQRKNKEPTNIQPKPQISTKIEHNEPTNIQPKPQISAKITDEDIKKIRDFLMAYKNGVKVSSISRFLKIDQSLATKITEIFSSDPNYEVKVNNKVDPPVTKIKYIGELETDFLGGEIVNFILDMCRAERILILSDLPKDVKDMKTKAEISDEKFVEILEDNGFRIIEIRSKFINSEFVAFSDSVENDDPTLFSMIEKAKNRIQKYFKTKVKYTFLKNMYFSSLDNNYSSSLKERILYFYRFICEQMKSNDDFFYFNTDSLLNMNFLSFIKCIPLRGDFQFIKTIFNIVKMNRNIDSVFLKGIENVDDLLETEYSRINDECMEIAKNFTLGDVLNALNKNSENFKSLESRLNIHEFDRILQSLINYNIFEGYIDSGYLYFEKIDGVESYIDKVLSEVSDEAADGVINFAAYPDRMRFYGMIRDISQDQFLDRAYDLVNDNFDGNTRDFFIKKLQAFK